jgi:hypothetical protein
MIRQVDDIMASAVHATDRKAFLDCIATQVTLEFLLKAQLYYIPLTSTKQPCTLRLSGPREIVGYCVSVWFSVPHFDRDAFFAVQIGRFDIAPPV